MCVFLIAFGMLFLLAMLPYPFGVIIWGLVGLSAFLLLICVITRNKDSPTEYVHQKPQYKQKKIEYMTEEDFMASIDMYSNFD